MPTLLAHSVSHKAINAETLLKISLNNIELGSADRISLKKNIFEWFKMNHSSEKVNVLHGNVKARVLVFYFSSSGVYKSCVACHL